MADYPVVTFDDCEAGSWYAPYVEWAAQAGIVKGYSAEAFGPMDEITVEQAAVILYRYIAYMGYNTAADAEAVKVLNNGMLLIRKGNKTYNVMGQAVK